MMFHSRSKFLAAGLLAIGVATAASAQVAGPWLTFTGPNSGAIEIPHHTDLNPSSALTIEAWVKLEDYNGYPSNSCVGVAGKGYASSYWLGICSGSVRFYPQGSGSSLTGPTAIPIGVWTHVAATYDGTVTRLYINATLDAESFTVSGPPSASTNPLKLGNDANWDYSPNGALDDVRLWSVARTVSQLAADMHTHFNAPTTGLVSVWHLDGNAEDAIGNHDGVKMGDAIYSDDPLACTSTYFVPAGAHAPGSGGSQWVTDLDLLNTTVNAATVRIYLLPRDSDNSSATFLTMAMPAGSALSLPDVIEDEFGSDNLSAAFKICSNFALHVTSRTYNQSSSGTFGQGIPGRRSADAIAPGSSAYLWGLAENAAYRTNVGFVNTYGSAATVTVELYAANGALLGSRNYNLPPFGHLQRSRIFTEVGATDVTGGFVEIVPNGAPIFAYASVVDAATGDGTYYEAE